MPTHLVVCGKKLLQSDKGMCIAHCEIPTSGCPPHSQNVLEELEGPHKGIGAFVNSPLNSKQRPNAEQF